MGQRVLVRGDAVSTGLVAGGLAAVVAAAVVALDGIDGLFTGDAAIYRVVARWPFADGSAIQHLHTLIAKDGTAYRYGRIGAPLLAWIVAGGRAALVTYTFPLVNVVAIGASVGFAAELLARHGVESRKGLLILAVPGFIAGTATVGVEPVAVAFTLGAFVAFEDDRVGLAIALGSYAILTREVMVLAFIPWVVRDRNRRWILLVVPYGAWCAWLRVRTGTFPFTDPAARGGIDLPGLGLLHSLQHAQLGPELHALSLALQLVAAVTFVAGSRLRRAAFGEAALALAVLAVFLGPGEFDFVGGGLRVLAPAHVFTVLAAFSRKEPRLTGAPS